MKYICLQNTSGNQQRMRSNASRSAGRLLRVSLALFLVLGLVLGLVAGLMPGLTGTAAAENAAQAARVRQEIERASARFAEAFARKDAAALAAMYADNAKLLPQFGAMITGKAAIRVFWEGLLKAGGQDFILTTVHVGYDGGLAYEVGAYLLTIAPKSAKPITDKGKYVVVWRRQADGSWKLAADIFNSDAPPPARN